jgi:hypothetical protein
MVITSAKYNSNVIPKQYSKQLKEIISSLLVVDKTERVLIKKLMTNNHLFTTFLGMKSNEFHKDR